MTAVRLSLAQQVLLGLGLGVFTGLFFGEMVAWLQIVGDLFINLLRITVIPFLSLALITGLGGLGYSQVKRLVVRGGAVLLIIWMTTLALVFLIPLAFPDWPSGSFFDIALTRTAPSPDFMQLFIPSNPFFAYANAIVPAVVVFSVMLGLALIGVPQRQAILDPLEALRDALMRITSNIAKLSPYGVFALLAATVGKFDVQDLMRLQVYIVLYGFSAVLLALWVLPALVAALTPLGYREVVRALRTPMITAFATGSTLVVLPLVIEACRELMRNSPAVPASAKEEAESSIEVMIPIFYPAPPAGSVLALSFLLYAGWYMGSTLSTSGYSGLVMMGLPTLFGGTFLAIGTMLDQLQLPSDMLQVFVAVDAITSRFGTLLGTAHYATIGLIGTFALVHRPRFRWLPLSRLLVISIVLLSGLLVSARLLYGAISAPSDSKANALRQLTLSGAARPVIDYEESLLGTVSQLGPASFDEILKRGVLRVCYQPDEYPSAFMNSREPAQLVGFDIDMAHRFAARRNLSLAFLATRDEASAAQHLNGGDCDIYMRSMPVSAGRSQQFGLTSPLYESTLALIVRDHRREEFRTWEQLRARGPALNIAVEAAADTMGMVKDLLPAARITPIGDLSEQATMLESGSWKVDAIVDQAEEGAAHTLFFPQFKVVVPQPTVSIPVAYAVARNNQGLLTAIDAWLVTEKAKGTVDALYEHWMLGGAVMRERPPTWSIIRNVLGWVEQTGRSK